MINSVNVRGVFGESGRAPNTYIEMECEGQIHRSPVMRRDYNPRFHEDNFKFTVSDYETSKLNVRLMDHKTKECMAAMMVPCIRFRNDPRM